MPADARSLSANLDLVAALAAIPHGARLCTVLTYHDGYTHDEIAEITGLPVGTVKSHIVRGVARLLGGIDRAVAIGIVLVLIVRRYGFRLFRIRESQT